MNNVKKNAVKFLEKYQMYFADIDIAKNVKAFVAEMQKGLETKSSLDMIPTYIEVGKDIPVGRPVVAIDAGGTNFRSAVVYFDKDKNPVIEKLSKHPMPGVQHELSRDDFFKAMALLVKDIAGTSKEFGFCFSYPTEMMPSKDGRLVRFCKEIKARDIKGEPVGENLNRAMASIGFEANKRIVILNDTVATLLAGVGHHNRVFSGYIGFILGTGTNCCYLEKNSNIKKASGLDPAGTQIINTESGGFAPGKRGKLDIALDGTTKDPGQQQFEKMISGAYLGAICLFVLKTACDDGLFSKAAADAITQIKELNTKQVNDFLYHPYGDNVLAAACGKGGEIDTATAVFIADSLIERAAKFTAIKLSAMAIKSGCQTRIDRPVCIVAEGTTFYQMKGLRRKIEFYLKQYLENEAGIYWEIVSVDNASLVGAAIAGLTN